MQDNTPLTYGILKATLQEALSAQGQLFGGELQLLRTTIRKDIRKDTLRIVQDAINAHTIREEAWIDARFEALENRIMGLMRDHIEVSREIVQVLRDKNIVTADSNLPAKVRLLSESA